MLYFDSTDGLFHSIDSNYYSRDFRPFEQISSKRICEKLNMKDIPFFPVLFNYHFNFFFSFFIFLALAAEGKNCHYQLHHQIK